MAGAGAMEWTLEEKRDFEDAMEEVPDETPAKLEIIAARMRKPVEDEKLVQDVEESGGDVVPPRRSRWSVEEDKRFLRGLEALGAGNWTAISRDFVKTRDAIQVKAYGIRYLKNAKKQD